MPKRPAIAGLAATAALVLAAACSPDAHHHTVHHTTVVHHTVVHHTVTHHVVVHHH